jgi:homoserine O-acetyltransferase
MKILRYVSPFLTETGAILPELEIAYDTWGKLNSEGDNVIWICHALTANSDVESWWPGMIGKGLLFDPERFFIVCANVLGSCYGTTGPASVNPETKRLWLKDFPRITVRDLVNVHEILRKHLNIISIHSVLGASIGGFQSLEYSIMYPDVVKRLIFLASSSKQSPWAIAFSQSQRLAMEADTTFNGNDPDGGKKGLKAARSIALLSYRNSAAYNRTQVEPDDEKIDSFKASSYQDYQGDKLVNRFNPYSYYCLVCLSDTHNVGRGRGGVDRALSGVKVKTLCIGITSDILFPVEEQKYVAEQIPGAQYIEIDSFYGHDGFLIESMLVTEVVRKFWDNDLFLENHCQVNDSADGDISFLSQEKSGNR